MINLHDRKIATKIGVVIGLFSLLLVLCAGFALLGLAKNNNIVQTVLGDQGKSLYLASTAAEQKTRIHQRAFELLADSDATHWSSLQSAFEKDASELGVTMSNLKPMMDSEDIKFFSPIQNSLDKYLDLEKQGYAMRQGGRGKNFEVLLEGGMAKEFEVMDTSFDALVEKQKHDMEQATAEIDAAATATQWQTVALSVIGLLGTIVAAFFLVRLQITRPLAVLTSSMGKLASGDISINVVGQKRKDEIGALANALQVFKQNGLKLKASEAEAKRLGLMTAEERARADAQQAMTTREQKQVVESLATGLESLSQGQLTFRLGEAFASDYEKLRSDFNGAMEKLQDTMKMVSTTTSAIRSGTSEISSASDDLSRRTEQQAASLEETAAALDEITATVRKTAEGSKHAREVVGQTKQAAERSGEVVKQAVVAMSGIEKSSSQIGNIIGVIDEIAFQTNLLALNAGVEAARAGDAGRGFAVVASEVRALAQRSADAAKEIKALILASSTQVEQGVNLVGQTGKALELIVTQVAEINGIVTEIAASAQEQAVGLDQVNTAVNQMDQVTQQNAAMVEESTAASHALSQEAEELTRLMSRFKVGQVGGSPSQRPVPKAVQPVRTATRPVAVSALKNRGHNGAALKAVAVATDWQEF